MKIREWRTHAVAALILIFLCSVFIVSRVRQFADSNYSVLLSESLLYHGNFALDNYDLPRNPPTPQVGYISNGETYQLELVGDRIYYFFPPGSSILSMPFVAVMNALGISASTSDGHYNPDGDKKIQAVLAAVLMATLGSIIFYTAQLLLPLRWSLMVAVGSALGTQIWSTASRALWADTWGIFLIGLVIWMLVGVEAGKHRLRPVFLATLLSWSYFVRPTYALPIVAVTVYLFFFHRRSLLWYLATGAVWGAAFIAYSWHHFGQLLPNYYAANRLSFGSFWTALAGNLISPSRGLMVYVPLTLFVAYLCARYAGTISAPRLLVLSLCVIVAHLILVSGFTPWYGGHCFGPRYSTGIVPWLSLLAILGVQARLVWRDKRASQSSNLRWRLESGVGAGLLVGSMIINALGATAPRTWLWNITPVNVDAHPERVWDWSDPQFLAR